MTQRVGKEFALGCALAKGAHLPNHSAKSWGNQIIPGKSQIESIAPENAQPVQSPLP